MSVKRAYTKGVYSSISKKPKLIKSSPPPSRNGVWMRYLNEHMESLSDGEWHQIDGEWNLGLCWGLNNGKYQLPPGNWEFTQRLVSERAANIWVRYLGAGKLIVEDAEIDRVEIEIAGMPG